MCGIVGGWWSREPAGLEKRLREAQGSLVHRGPDDSGLVMHRGPEGTLALGHRRLSIIDLSEAGRQPMRSADGRYEIVLNGEIYNYRELRQELEGHGFLFTTKTDTEVLLNAWILWGEQCLPRLVGMFAFSVYDRMGKRLVCARDAFGIKPLFYFLDSGEFAFASEIPALRSLSSGKLELNLQRAYDYLVFGRYDDGEQTFFEKVHHLLPGHLLSLSVSGKVTRPVPRRWYWPDITERRDLTFDQAAEKLREMFLHNIRLHLRSDVPLGAALSGGIDSSAVVCAMRHVEPAMPIHTFSYVARGAEVDEEPWVDIINSHTKAVSHKVVVSADELVRDLDDMIRLQGEPFGSTSIYAQYRVFRLAAESGITVTLDGQGADELLAGYDGYPRARMLSLLNRGRLGSLARFLRGWSRWPGRSARMGAVNLGSLFVPKRFRPFAMGLVNRHVVPEWIDGDYLRDRGVVLGPAEPVLSPECSGRRLMETLRHLLTVGGLTYLLRHGDRNSMRFSIESRVPFLTTELADFLLRLPEDYLVSPVGETKRIFRAAMRGIVPDRILDRRDKIGFQTPEGEWLLGKAPLLRSWIRSGEDVPFIRHDAMTRAFDGLVKRRVPSDSPVWRWILFLRWQELSF